MLALTCKRSHPQGAAPCQVLPKSARGTEGPLACGTCPVTLPVSLPFSKLLRRGIVSFNAWFWIPEAGRTLCFPLPPSSVALHVLKQTTWSPSPHAGGPGPSTCPKGGRNVWVVGCCCVCWPGPQRVRLECSILWTRTAQLGQVPTRQRSAALFPDSSGALLCPFSSPPRGLRAHDAALHTSR